MQIGSVKLASNVLLAPLAGYTDLAFRLTVRGIPGHDQPKALGLAFTELLCSYAILNQSTKTMWLAATSRADRPVGMQLYGKDADVLAAAAQWAEAHGAVTLDINMGCPVDKVAKKNGGSLLLCNPPATVGLAARVVKAIKIPVTAKIRLGWDDTCLITDTLPAALADVGVAAITVHGRTTEQMFRDSVRIEGIAAVVAAVKRRHPQVPVIGNGDIKEAADARRMIDATGCDGVMIGRGALGFPWIFRDTACLLRTGSMPPPLTQAQRARIVLAHFDHLHRLRNEEHAVRMINQRISWYSAGLQPWPRLKHQVRLMTSAQEFREYLLAGIERLERGEPAVTMDAEVVAMEPAAATMESAA